MGLSKFIPTALWEPDKPSAPPGGNNPPPVVQPTMAAGVSVGTRISVGSSYLDPDMLADIQKVIARRPTDFSALEVNSKTLETVILDEMTRTKAAFQMLKVQGKSAGSVISSIDLHVRDIETEKTNFASAATAASNKKVGALRTEADQLTAQNERDTQTIQQLQQQIQQLQANMNDRTGTISQKTIEANTAEADIQARVGKFNAAADSVIATLNSKKTTLSSMLT